MKHILLSLLLIAAFKLSAQQAGNNIIIKGLIIDSISNNPLSYATVILRDALTSNPVKSLLTKDSGSFEFMVVANKPYTLSIAYVGYKPETIKVPAIASDANSINLGKIPLSALRGQLKEVSIIAAKPLLSQQIDRISFDVQADPESKANDVLEMLRKVPMVTVDANDDIQLKGSSNFQIFINGKPSALMANDPSDVLKAMPAATIQKIEVITTPPAKYDAEGLAGIINIVTLKQNDDGFTGSIFSRVNNVFGERGSVSLAAKKGKLGLNAFFGIGHQPDLTNSSGSTLTTFNPASYLSQQGQNVNGGNFNNGQVQLSYEVDTLNLLTASMDFNNRRFTRDMFRYSQFYAPTDSLSQAYQLNNIGGNNFGAFDVGINYQLGFKQDKNELLTISYQYASTTNNQTNSITTSDQFNYSGSNYDQENDAGTKENTFQVDFVKPVKKLTIEVGAKAILRYNFSNFESSSVDQATGLYTIDTSLTNQFSYHQNVYSAYNSYQLKLTGWAFKAGLRAENTVIDDSFATNNASISQNYVNFIPAISIQRNYKETGSFTLGFTERIQRPWISQLNPFVDRSNPDFIVTGNPNLRPVLNHIVELGYSKFGKISFNSNINYSFANNTIQNVTSLINDTLSKTTFLNVGKYQSVGTNLSLNYPFTNKFNFNINAQLSYLWITGTYNSQFYKNSGTQGNLEAFARYNFDPGFNIGLNYGYNSGRIFLQGKSSNYIYTGVVFVKDILEKRADFSLTIYNPFDQYSYYSTFTKTTYFEQSTSSRYYYRNFRLTFSYKFGKLKSNIKTNRRGINNDDVKKDTGESQ